MQTQANYTILVVDDEESIIEFLKYNIQKEGYKVYSASNGQEGVEMAHRLKPDLILLDLMMPIMDGIEACQLIREHDKNYV
ncbi:MAG: response regulator, partial [Flavobacteriia bacterium]